MREFIRKHASSVTGVLNGFDRVLFRGTFRNLIMGTGIMLYLSVNKILFKDAGKHFDEVTKSVKEASLEAARRKNRPVLYLASAQKSKEDIAREMAAKDGITEGLIGALTCVEPCQTLVIDRDREKKQQHIRWGQRKCLHVYQYHLHSQFGLMHTRLQTWFPFTMTVCINGREWLSRQLDAAGVGYRKADNCFLELEDVARAQALADAQLKTDWVGVLQGLARESNPLCPEVLGKFATEYYWTAYQTEWASDVMFKNAEELARIYPRLVRHGITTFACRDTLRFLGQHVPATGRLAGTVKAKVTSSLKERPEGLRLKHWVNSNSVKLYDKQGRVLRFETTINQPGAFKAYRPKEGGPEEEKSWRKMRQGVADLHRRAEVSQGCNDRYAASLAKVDSEQELGALLAPLTRSVQWRKTNARGLQPFGKDAELLAALGDGAWALKGLRNQDLQARLCAGKAANGQEKRSRSGKVTRLIRLLRAHGLLNKIPKTHRYHLSDKGREVVVALSAAKHAGTKKLTQLAA
jgi:hypothetical protein